MNKRQKKQKKSRFSSVARNIMGLLFIVACLSAIVNMLIDYGQERCKNQYLNELANELHAYEIERICDEVGKEFGVKSVYLGGDENVCEFRFTDDPDNWDAFKLGDLKTIKYTIDKLKERGRLK